ncbi:hypothetical protein ISF_05152 [Cordyceps fumosorosea ARSEF 2679]|uniref:Uncharacterized protein n=1 Tax=Cordyceps fumosorosea (strain ARSEF 2679) TaxID=1081104 RepID=A0A167V238_CORFA|nr:hypothetical protein ISF_05152 [Cordyceps fumosorosea ARSEF 2679]OAA62143.1 hypothetical protein ISF_05152 [Cordyceps fumosorosea ARSEF 2679]
MANTEALSKIRGRAVSVIEDLRSMLQGIPFIIAGDLARIYYGFDRDTRNVFIICSQRFHDTILYRAGMPQMKPRDLEGRQSFNHRTNDGSTFTVHVVAAECDPLLNADIHDNQLNITRLPCLLAECARFYANYPDERGPHDECILWMMRKTAERNQARRCRDDRQWAFTDDQLEILLNDNFLEPFIIDHPEAAEILYSAGAFWDVGPCYRPGRKAATFVWHIGHGSLARMDSSVMEKNLSNWLLERHGQHGFNSPEGNPLSSRFSGEDGDRYYR